MALFASDLGMRPGQWFDTINHEGRVYRRKDRLSANGELVGYKYRDDIGNEITVYND